MGRGTRRHRENTETFAGKPPWWQAYAPLIAAGAALAVYLPSLAGGFLYDDRQLAQASMADLRNLRAIVLYEPARPILTLSWALTHAIAGLAPWAYHLGNVLIHAANAALLGWLLLWIGQCLGWSAARQRALLGACLFAVSPMVGEAVAYVASRSSVLAACFSLCALRVVLPALLGASRWRLLPGILLFVCALGTKEEAAAVPALLLLLDYFCVAGQRFSEVWRRRGIHLPFIGLVLLGLFARRAVTGAWLPVAEVDRLRYAITQAAAFPLYLLRALVPLDPALYRGHPLAPWPPDVGTALGVVATVALIAAAIRLRRERPEWSLCVAWLAACLAPSSSIAPLSEMVVDHRAYLGMALPCLCVAALLWRPGRTGLVTVVLLGLGLVALRFEWVLADPVRAWEECARRAPSSAVVWRSLGEAYVASGDEARAEAALRKATELDPADFRSWTNRGVFYALRGRTAEAEESLRIAARLHPARAQIHENLALVLDAAGKEDEAVAELGEAMRLEPDMAAAKIDLARILLRKGERARAADLLDAAARLPLSEQDRLLVASLRDHLRYDQREP